FWRWRWHLRRVLTLTIVLFVALAFLMEAPVWYLIARIDLAGGSTSWHRAELIHQAIRHFDEWWLIGTDYTRHWMAYGIEWSEDHVDITNHYITLGVRGGILLMGIFIIFLIRAFQALGRGMKALQLSGDTQSEFLLWCVGASLFLHAFTFMAISYFDQSYVFFCSVVAGSGLGVLHTQLVATRTHEKQHRGTLTPSRA
ncbi:MAG: hypothetical protein ACK4UN_17155, partial [Limisphaerales bacterium]